MKMSNPYVGGIPDLWYSGDRDDLWVEYKFIVVPKRDETLVHIDLSPLQERWLAQRFLEGRNVAVVVGCKQGGVFMRAEQWAQTWSTGQFNGAMSSRQGLAGIIEALTMRKKLT